MVNVEMRWVIHSLDGLHGWCRELGVLLVMLLDDLVLVGIISSLGEHAFLVQHRQDSHWLLHKFNGTFQIKTEVNELPDNSFLLVFFLFQDEHVVVEELLQSLVGQVNTQLLECVELK